MQTQDLKRSNSSGHGHGNHVCNKCGWSFPNPHPSAKQRRAHKKNCGKMEGFKHGTASEENKANLDEHLFEDDSKSPTNGLEVVKKVEEMAITRSSSSGLDDVFSDAVTEFAGGTPASTGSSGVRKTAVVMQGSSEAVGVTQQDVENAVEDAGDLYPSHTGNGTQNQNVECSRPETDRSEMYVPAQHHLPSSPIDSISSTDSSVVAASGNENTLSCSKIDNVADSEEKGNLEAALDKKSEDTAYVSSEKVNGDELDFGDTNEFNFAGETYCSEKGTTEVENSEDTTGISAEFAGKTPEAVFVPQMVNTENPKLFPANAAMDANESQAEGFFDARNLSFAKEDVFGQIDILEEASNVEADRSLEMLEGQGSINVPDALPLNEHSETMLEIYEDQKTEKLDLAWEVEGVEHGKDDVNKEAFSSLSLDEPSKSPNQKPEDIISEEVSVEQKTDTLATDAAIRAGSPEQKNSVISIVDNVHSDLDESGNLTRTVNDAKPVLDDSEHYKKDTQIFDALEADSSEVEEERLPVAVHSAVDYNVKTREVEENLSEDTPIVAQSDDERGDKDLDSSSKQVVSGGDVNLLDTNVISGIDDNAKITEETQFEENFVASDNVSLLNIGSQPVVNEIVEDARDREIFGEKVSGKECLGRVDLGLISDNDDNVDLTQNGLTKVEAEVQAQAVSAVEDSYTKKKDEGGSDFAGDRGNLVKQEAVQDLDVQVDSVSQTDSVEGNWGSVSVLSSFSDAPAGAETGSQPSQSAQVEKDSLQPKPKPDISNLPDVIKSPEPKIDTSGKNEGLPEAQTSEKVDEIIAKVANWSTAPGKPQHTSLKNFLGDSSSPNAKDNPPFNSPQETEKKILTDSNTKEPEPEAAMGELQKEWDSPARYPTNIKREKGKVRSKPYWVPFMCCSSAQTR